VHTIKQFQHGTLTLPIKDNTFVCSHSMGITPELLIQAATGNKQAQYSLYKLSYSLLMSICHRYAPNFDDAMALLNLGFLKILLHAEKRKTNVPIEYWMRRIMINTAIDEFRKNKHYREQTELHDFTDHQQVMADNNEVSNEFNRQIESEVLQNMLHQLPDVTAKVFNLFAIDGYTHKEIADMLQISEGTSKWHVNNARTLLKKLINQLD
jgi:RNA polymerase sigma factor (sigma-70 family)